VITFMIIGAPRSGTAWCSNWCTTELSLCLHELCITHDLEDLDTIPCDRILGLADTGIALFPDWLKRHPARKVILHRDMREIDLSLRRAGLPPLDHNWEDDLARIDGFHVDWREIFHHPEIIHDHLFEGHIPFDAPRHALLRQLNVQADFEKLDPDPAVCRRLIQRMMGNVR